MGGGHHNMTAIASAATSVVIGYLAGGTNIPGGFWRYHAAYHSPLVIAEQFGTLESLYPGRIDLAWVVRPGTDQTTLRALRRDPGRSDDFPRTFGVAVVTGSSKPGQAVRAVPGYGTEEFLSGSSESSTSALN